MYIYMYIYIHTHTHIYIYIYVSDSITVQYLHEKRGVVFSSPPSPWTRRAGGGGQLGHRTAGLLTWAWLRVVQGLRMLGFSFL